MNDSKYIKKTTPSKNSQRQAELFAKYGLKYPFCNETTELDTLAIRKDLKSNELLITKLEETLGKDGLELLQDDEYKALIEKYLWRQYDKGLTTNEEAIELLSKTYSSDELLNLWWKKLQELDLIRNYPDDIYLEWAEASLNKLGIDAYKATEEW